MAQAPRTRPTEEFLPDRFTLPALARAAAECRGCRLYARATQTVFGRGSTRAELMLVGEQPGDREDRQGEPFVGPAGGLLDRALDEAGVPKKLVYVTNAVKHFNWEERGKSRIHKQPKPGDVRACRPWLLAEIETVKPSLLVLLGAVAAKSILGQAFRVSVDRGKLQETDVGPRAIATWHPSAILRAPDHEARDRSYRELLADLKKAARSI